MKISYIKCELLITSKVTKCSKTICCLLWALTWIRKNIHRIWENPGFCSIPAISEHNIKILWNTSVLHGNIQCYYLSCTAFRRRCSASCSFPSSFKMLAKLFIAWSYSECSLKSIHGNRPHNSQHHSEKIKFIYTS